MRSFGSSHGFLIYAPLYSVMPRYHTGYEPAVTLWLPTWRNLIGTLEQVQTPSPPRCAGIDGQHIARKLLVCGIALRS